MKRNRVRVRTGALVSALLFALLSLVKIAPPCLAQSPSAKENSAPVKAMGLPTTFTTMSVTNGTNQKQYFYITLTPVSVTVPNYPAGEEINNLSQVTFTGNFQPGEGVITAIGGSPLEGYFFLNAGNTANYAPQATFSANFYTNGTPGTNNNQCFTGLPGVGVGATFAEVTLNVDGNYLGDETVDISEVNGINALWEVSLPLPAGSLAPPSNNYPKYFSTSGYVFPNNNTVTPWGTFQQGQLIPVPTIANNPGRYWPCSGDANATLPYGVGKGTVGVYPFGCDNCTSRAKPGCSGKYPPASLVQQSLSICQVLRNCNYQIGGNVGLTLKKFPYPVYQVLKKTGGK